LLDVIQVHHDGGYCERCAALREGIIAWIHTRRDPSCGAESLPLDGASRNKTTKMRVIESALGEPIELLLVGQSVGQAAKKLGLNKGTVSTWRRWLGLK